MGQLFRGMPGSSDRTPQLEPLRKSFSALFSTAQRTWSTTQASSRGQGMSSIQLASLFLDIYSLPVAALRPIYCAGLADS